MIETILALIIFLFPLAYSPGPGNMFFAANGARFGFRATIAANLGYHLATFIVTLVIGLGFSTVLLRAPQVFIALKFAGTAYLLWIAWKLFRAGATQDQQKARPANFWDGVALLLLNPKAYVIIALMFTQFLNGGHGNGFSQIWQITIVFTLNNMIAFVVWTSAGDYLAHSFRQPHHAGRLNMIFGVILAGVALWMLLL